MKSGVSVIICTYNGALRLPKTFEYLARQQSDFEWEIILVDNNSSDESSAIAVSVWNQLGRNVPLYVYREAKAGKYYALQLALAKANYEYFVICDDDNGLSEDYLIKVFQLLRDHPEVGAVGGRSIAVVEDGIVLPDWFADYQEGYAIGRQAKVSGYVPIKHGRLWGAGLASRTVLYREVYNTLQLLLLDLKNQSVLTTEDTEYCARLLLRGYRLFYEDSLLLYHYLPKSRLTEFYRDQIYKNFFLASKILDKYRIAIKLKYNKSPKWLFKLRLLIISPLRLVIAKDQRSRDYQTAVLRFLCPFLFGNDVIIRKIKSFSSNKGMI